MNTMVARHEQLHRVELSAHITATSTAFQQLLSEATALTANRGGSPLQAYGIINGILSQQARLRSYVDDFQYLAAVCFLCIPIVFMLRKAVARKGTVGAAH